jgi:hypothetical protein
MDTIILSVGIEVYSTVDGGANWTNNSNGLEVMDSLDLIFDLQKDPLDANRMALASSKGIFISEDGGLNWDRKTNSLVHKIAFSTETEGAMTATTYSSQFSELSLHYSTDSGETWETINNEQLLGIASSSSTYRFEENSVVVYIGSFDLGLVEYTIALNVLGSPEFGNGDSSIAIYPNPTSDIINISLKNSNVDKVTVYSVSGAKVMEIEDAEKLNISNLVAGVYLVRVKDSNNAIFFNRIVKQ